MNEFNAAIAAFLAGKGGFGELEAALGRALEVDPAGGPAAFAEIDRIYKSGRLPLQLYVVLKNRIAQSHASAAQRPRPAPPPPAPAVESRPPEPAAAHDDFNATVFGARPAARAAPPSPPP